MSVLAGTVPIVTGEEAREIEARLFAGNETQEWVAMQRAGNALAEALLRDAAEMGGLPPACRILVLVGKGHNGGDALIAAGALLKTHPLARVEVVFVFGERVVRPLTARAWREVASLPDQRVTATPELPAAGARSPVYDVAIDGVFGFQFRPPAAPWLAELFDRVNALPIRLRAAVDLPSAELFRADFTYATGSVKAPVMEGETAGRIRYLDLGFFPDGGAGGRRVLTSRLLASLAGLRPATSDKRSFGHVFVVGGSRGFPGAILMTVLAALRSGAGLVTAFVPESVASAFAARAPEAMWVAWPETPGGGLALEGAHLLRERRSRATSLVLGPGLGRERETHALIADMVREATVPLVIDADALQPESVGAGNAPRILTPHAGEFARIAGGMQLTEFAQPPGRTVLLKGTVTRVAQGSTVYHSFFGGPVLARGGSGDVLAGLIAGLLAQAPDDPVLAACRGAVWHGMAADCLARAHGQTPVCVTQLLDFLPAALRASGFEAPASPPP